MLRMQDYIPIVLLPAEILLTSIFVRPGSGSERVVFRNEGEGDVKFSLKLLSLTCKADQGCFETFPLFS